MCSAFLMEKVNGFRRFILTAVCKFGIGTKEIFRIDKLANFPIDHFANWPIGNIANKEYVFMNEIETHFEIQK